MQQNNDRINVQAVKELFPGVEERDRIVFIGFDSRETTAYQVLKFSIMKTSPGVKVFPLYARDLRQAGLYSRPMLVSGNSGQFIDTTENRPHSVEFSFTRFLVPQICRILGHKGWALFMDCDMLVTQDLNDVFRKLEQSGGAFPLAVVKHNFKPEKTIKMDGVSQLAYNRKLWSAVMFFNNFHYKNEILTSDRVNTAEGMYLHNFHWLPGSDEDTMIGLDENYQFIPGHSNTNLATTPCIIHYTEKAPWFKGEFEEKGYYADIWWEYSMKYRESLGGTAKYTKWWI